VTIEPKSPKEDPANRAVTKERYVYPNLKLRVYTTGIRQNRLAKLVGIDEAYLSRIINGVRVPGKQMQEQIAHALGCDAEWLFQQTAIQMLPVNSNPASAKLDYGNS
jgi:transcriptional regulator with XRE-family HTH domain